MKAKPLLRQKSVPLEAWDPEEKDKPKLKDFGLEYAPSLASVLLLSSPRLLLASSVNSFIAGLNVYLVFVWKRQLDQSAGRNSSKDVFIVSIVVTALSYFNLCTNLSCTCWSS